MSKPIRFSLWLIGGAFVVWPIQAWIQSNYPIADKILTVISGLILMYWAGLHLYEHWDDK